MELVEMVVEIPVIKRAKFLNKNNAIHIRSKQQRTHWILIIVTGNDPTGFPQNQWVLYYNLE